MDIDNFDCDAWSYVLSCYPVTITRSQCVVKTVYMMDVECIIEKTKEEQETFALNNANHLLFAQNLLGSSIGIGVHCMLLC
jgi:hypothetical protein